MSDDHSGPATEAPRRSRILDQGLRIAVPTMVLFGVFLFFRGHNAPGGGFSGGLVVAAAFVLRAVAGEPVRPPMRPVVLIGLGLLIATATGAAAWLFGAEFLESGRVELDLPLLGPVKTFSVLAFDAGVLLVVVGMITLVLDELGLGRDSEQMP